MFADFTLTVLGTSPATPNPGGACSGYLLRSGDAAVLVDCGHGVVSRLRQHIALERLTAVVISHLHADHHFDLLPLYYGLKFGPAQPIQTGWRLPLYLPAGGPEHMRLLAQAAGGHNPDMFPDVYAITTYQPGREEAVGPFTFTFHRVLHYIPSFAMRIRLGASGPLLVFSSDVGPCSQLVEAAHGADLFLCEANMGGPTEDDPDPAERGHLLASEAAAAAQAAGVHRLLLTHYRTDAGGTLEAFHLSSASAAFSGPVDLAQEGQTYPVRP